MQDAEGPRRDQVRQNLGSTKTTFRVAKRMVTSATNLYNSVSEAAAIHTARPRKD